MNLPPGTRLVPLERHADRRGWLIEAFRRDWGLGIDGAQVNVTWSRAGTLRGTHVHGVHTDLFFVAVGASVVGLRDIRRRSPAFGAGTLLELKAETQAALLVPPGVVHGLYFPVDSLLVTIEGATYDPREEVRCRWSDPELAIAWPFTSAVLSGEDEAAPSFADMMSFMERWQDRFEV